MKDDLDFNYEFGKYILTGSSTPADKTEVHHSGAGRIAPLNMRPMTLWESKESKGTVSLWEHRDRLFDLKVQSEHSSSSVSRLANTNFTNWTN